MFEFIISAIGIPLGYIMWICYSLVGNYGMAVVLFTLMTKIIVFPVSIKVQKNSIKMVKLKPKLDEIAARYAGDKDLIAEEQMKLYDEEHYSPAAGCLPMFIQLLLILGLINVIYKPLQHLLHMKQGVIDLLVNKTAEILGMESLGGAAQIKVIETIGQVENLAKFQELQEKLTGENINTFIEQIQNINTNFLGLNLSEIPSLHTVNQLIIIPILAVASAFLLCIIQNKFNVLQAEQSQKNKWGMTIFNVAFSLYFTFIVPAGVGLYWIFSNVFSILQLFLLNKMYDPKQYIDYRSRQETTPIVLSKEEKEAVALKIKENKKREKNDYQRFYEDNNKKQLVFYSEKSGFYKYFENVIEQVLMNSDIVIHYVTSDPDDAIFKKSNPRIIPYYIGEKKLITFMMQMDADMVVMTMPDLQTFHIKRSLIRKDVEYVYMFHYPLSTHMVLRKNALDHFDTIFCVGEFQFDEIRQWERLNGLKEKKLVKCGYGVIENMYTCYMSTYDERMALEKAVKKVLIAPSWQEDNILDSCINELLENILGKGYEVTVRPHPEYVKRYGSRMDAIVKHHESYSGDDLIFELDFSSTSSIFNADIVITDWSGTAYEFAFVTKKPALFINTKPKINNLDYDKIEAKPLEMTLRDKIGKQVNMNELSKASEIIEEMLMLKEQFSQEISDILDKTIFNFGESGRTGAEYIIATLTQKSKRED